MPAILPALVYGQVIKCELTGFWFKGVSRMFAHSTQPKNIRNVVDETKMFFSTHSNKKVQYTKKIRDFAHNKGARMLF